MKTTNLLLSVCVGLMALTSCKDESEANEDWCLDSAYRVPLSININIDRSFSEYTDVDSTMMDAMQYRSTRGDPTWQLQYHVAVYEKGKQLPSDVFSSFENPVKVKARPGKYRFAAWASYTPPISSRSHYFNVDDFSEIMLKQKYDYSGGDSYKVPYRGIREHSVAYTSDTLSMDLSPAMAKFRLIATDTPDYTPAKTTVSYESVPAAVNGLTGKVNYFWNDVQFSSAINGDELATDYVLSHPEETEVFAKIEIFDDENNLRARLTHLRIPLVNGGVTTIRGNFYSVFDLNGLDAGGIAIDTDFEGTYEIEI
ncbi:MAG: hypothetical protein NC095_11665 [Muribaculum sp.]|nr:hypothetical protein [Muribaculum sp.]